MKLIDKDKLHLTYKQGAYIGHGICDGEGYYVDGNEVANAPIIKAIPISELRRWLNKQDMPYKDYVIDVVEHAINAWEKENGN